MFEKYDIVCLAPGFWDESWLDVHRYMYLLAEHNRVLVVERAVTPVSIITRGQRHHALPQLRYWLSGQLRQPHENLIIATPPPILPLRYEDGILHINQTIRRRWLQSMLRKLNFDNPLLWVYDPDAAPLIGHLNERFSLYMVTDDYATNPSSLNRTQQVRKWDNRMAQSVDLVITSEAKLAAQKCTHNPNTFYVPHGVEHDLFSQALDPDLPVAPEVAAIEGEIVGFVGRLNQRIDLSIIEAITQHWTLLLVGQLGDDDVAAAIQTMPNVVCVGQQPVATLPQYLRAMSACIIPYHLTEHTQHMHPLKALEYLAAGRPVISTSLPSLQVHKDFISFADTPADFVTAIDHAIQSDTPEKQTARNQYTASMTWADSLQHIYSHYENTQKQT